MDKKVVTTNKNAKVALSKSKNLLNLTSKILEKKDDEWMEKLWWWADINNIPDYEWVNDTDFNEGGYYNGIPRNKDKLIKLEVLRLYDLDLKKIPDDIFNLIQLSELQIINCNLDYIPKSIKKLKNLTNLNLVKNNLSTLPDEIKYLKKLKNIHLTSNKFEAFPEVLYSLISLKHICIDTSIPIYISEKIENLINLLDFKVNNLTAIPKEIKNLVNLTEFRLPENNLGNFPNGISNLVSVEKLFILGKSSSFLPSEISNLANLSTLFAMNFNRIKISNEITNLKHLYFIDCNEILFNLKNKYYNNLKLSGLAIINSRITKLPDSIVKLKNIKQLLLVKVESLILTSKQKQWINNLINKGVNIELDDDLLERNISNIDNEELQF